MKIVLSAKEQSAINSVIKIAKRSINKVCVSLGVPEEFKNKTQGIVNGYKDAFVEISESPYTYDDNIEITVNENLITSAATYIEEIFDNTCNFMISVFPACIVFGRTFGLTVDSFEEKLNKIEDAYQAQLAAEYAESVAAEAAEHND